jgi:site-specific DNA-methyltransferase (adenine-specific)
MMLELNQLYNMDCMEGMKQFPDKYFELAVVDPPYGIGMDKKRWSPSVGDMKSPRTEYVKKEWDKRPHKNYFDELFRVSKNCIIWGGNYFIDCIKRPSSGWIVWDKINNGFPTSDAELAFTTFQKRIMLFSYCWIGFSQGKPGRATPKDKEKRFHPTQKPVKLYEWILKHYAKPGDKILDTHVGSASSLIACHKAGHEHIGFELDADYYRMATERIERAKAQLNLF